jgi:hypothetical protein
MHRSVIVARRKPSRGSASPKVVKEPIQVYLDRDDRAILDRAAAAAGLSRAEVLRRGLRSFAAQERRIGPMEQFMRKLAASEWPADTPTDLGVNHDKYLAEIYMDTHEEAALKPRTRRPRPAR